MPFLNRYVVFAAGAWLAALSPASRAVEPLAVEPANEPSAVFGESEVQFTYLVKSADRFAGVLTWVHSARQRTLARGELNVTAGGDEPVEIKIPLRIPPVREGIAFDTELTVRLHVRDDEQPKAEHSRTVWIFPRDPFADRVEWLVGIAIALFDPAGQTVAAFDAMNIPFQTVRSASALEQIESGLIVIGEGVSFYEFPTLGDILPAVAAKGIPVLCLAPRDGRWLLPGMRNSEGPAPRAVSFRRSDVIAELDKRLDTAAWSRGGGMVKSRLEITSYRGLVTAEVSPDETAWPWIEFDYSGDGTGKWIVCGFGLIEHWDASPNARFFLARWFEEMSGKQFDFLSETSEARR
jgi:hypothetical protein